MEGYHLYKLTNGVYISVNNRFSCRKSLMNREGIYCGDKYRWCQLHQSPGDSTTTLPRAPFEVVGIFVNTVYSTVTMCYFFHMTSHTEALIVWEHLNINMIQVLPASIKCSKQLNGRRKGGTGWPCTLSTQAHPNTEQLNVSCFVVCWVITPK